MGKLLKAIRNNLNEKSYIKNINSLTLYKKGSSNNEGELSKSAKEYKELDNLEIKLRHRNLRVYLENSLVLKGKKFFIIGLPILLGVCTVAPWFFKGTKTKSIDVYKKVEIEFNEESLIKYQEGSEIIASTLGSKKYVREDIISHANGWDSLLSDAYICFGEGEKSYQAKFRIDDNDTWTYLSSEADPYFDLTDRKNNDNNIEIEKKYLDLIDEAANIFINESPIVKDEDAELIRSFIENNKNDIFVIITKYEYLGKMDLEYHKEYGLLKIIMLIIDLVYGVALFNYAVYNDIETPKLEVENGELVKTDSYIGLRYAALKYKELFLAAEKERITEINNILENYGGDKSILSTYEKKLLNKNDR